MAVGAGALLALTGGLAAPAIAAGLGAAVTAVGGTAVTATAVAGMNRCGRWEAHCRHSHSSCRYEQVWEVGGTLPAQPQRLQISVICFPVPCSPPYCKGAKPYLEDLARGSLPDDVF